MNVNNSVKTCWTKYVYIYDTFIFYIKKRGLNPLIRGKEGFKVFYNNFFLSNYLLSIIKAKKAYSGINGIVD